MESDSAPWRRQSNQIQQSSNGGSNVSSAYGAHSPPTSAYGAPPSPPTSGYGAPPPPPISGYGAPPPPPTSGYGELPTSGYGAPPPPPPPPTSRYGGPPPPPPPTPGNLPAVRIASEIGPKKGYEPPAAIQNAMMTKDKKPFTYTPGGLNLNEIRSPRMARRISRNAHTEDSCNPAQSQVQNVPTGPLPPAAIAAMQPQIAIPVFPPGGVPTGCAPPPPPPPGCAPPPPPPPPATGSVPGIPAPSVAASPVNRPQDFSPRPEFLSDIASHPPLRPVGQPPRSSFEPSQLPPLQVQLKPVSPKPSPESSSPSLQQLPFLPKSPVTEPQIKNVSPSPQLQGPVTPPQAFRSAPPSPPVQQIRGPTTPPVKAPVTPPVNNQKQAVTPPIRQPSTPPTPSLNKSPAPWLTSKPAQRESPPPWTMRQQSVEMQPPTPPTPQPGQQPYQPVTRVIPIMFEGSEPKAAAATPDQSYGKGSVPPQQYMATPPPQYSYSQQLPNNQQHRYVQPPPNMQNYIQQLPQQQAMQPQYIQQQNYVQPEQQSRTRIIPIQMEGANGSSQQHTYQSQNSYPGNNQTRNQNGDAVDNRKFQSQTSYTANPTQSRSFRVLQKITGSDEDSQKRLDESEY